MPTALNLETGKRAERKQLLTVAEWYAQIYIELTQMERATITQAYNAYMYGDTSVEIIPVYQYISGEYVQLELPPTPADVSILQGSDPVYKISDESGYVRELLGVRTEDSAIEFNADIETITDILGITYSDINKTEPQQTFDPFYVMGGSKLSEYLNACVLANKFEDYSNSFNVYLVALYDTDGNSGEMSAFTVKHTNCSIIPTAMGGSSYVNMPLEVHFSNIITVGSVDLDENDKFYLDCTFTPDA